MVFQKSGFRRAVTVLSVAVASIVGVPATVSAATPERVTFDVN
jgi:hypothetical protein